MTKYDTIFKAINDRYENGEITFEEAEELNDLAYGKYFTEMKSKAEYRLRKWKKEHDYDPKTKTVRIDNDGHRVGFEYNGNVSKKHNLREVSSAHQVWRNADSSIVWDNPNNKISTTRAEFNGKYPDSHKFGLAHEIGHFKERDNRHKDPDKYYDDARKKRDFIITQRVEHQKNPNYHDMNEEEYRADDYAVKTTSPKTMKHWIKDTKNVEDYFSARKF